MVSENKKEQFDDDLWTTYSISFQLITFLLMEIHKDVLYEKGKITNMLLEESSASPAVVDLACKLSLPVLLAHSIEIGLKSLVGPIRCHDLFHLYGELDQETKDKLKLDFRRFLVNYDFEDVLKEHRLDFVIWRYPEDLVKGKKILVKQSEIKKARETTKTGQQEWEKLFCALCSILNI